jgi:solute carrier family 25 (mitochondrial phosphate transporter), member 3
MVNAAVQICSDKENGGALQLTQGLGPTLLGYGLEGAMKFGVYEVAKPIFSALLTTTTGTGDSVTTNQGLVFVLSSFVAGAVAALLLVPMESLRIKQVTDPNYKNDNILTGIPKIIQEDGFGSMMSGVWAMLAKQVPYTFGKQVSFDVVAAALYGVLGKDTNKWTISILAAACASVVACLLSQPGDMILTETYQTAKPGKFPTVVSTISKRGGTSEFFRGTQARIVHVGLIITSQLVVYDIVKQMLGLPATGSH